MNAVTLGERGFRAYNFLVDRITQYNFLPDLNPCPCPGGSSIAPDIIPHQWKAMAHIFQLLHRLPKYHLQPQMNLPYLGPMFSTDAHTSSYGNELLILCKMDGGASYQQTVDLTSIRIASGTMYRASLTAYRLTFTSLPTNPTSDTYNFCAADAGETVVYIAQPPGVASDLDNMKFVPPSTLPFGATKMAVRVGYFPGTASNPGMNDNPAVDCTASCTIPVNHYNMDAWYQTFYLNSSNSVLGVSDPQKIPSQGL